jgi:hypothetical protein
MNGDLPTIKAIDDRFITFSNGRKQSLAEALHMRPGYSITTEAAQGSAAKYVYVFAPSEAALRMDGTSVLVQVSRATKELMFYTDCLEVLKNCATRSAERESATYPVAKVQANGHSKVDLFSGARISATKLHSWTIEPPEPPSKGFEHFRE